MFTRKEAKRSLENTKTDDVAGEKEAEEASASERPVRRKPSEAHSVLLRAREKQKLRKPNFIREESWRYKRVDSSWRRPKGIDSRMRLKLKDRPKNVEVGYRSPRAVRGFHPSGFEERIVFTVKDLDEVGADQVVRIGHTVGSKKRLQIVERAEELGLRILNARGVGSDELKESEKTGI